MKHTLPDSSSPRRDLGFQDSYIVITPQIPDLPGLVWIWLPCYLGHAGPLVLQSLNPPTSCQGCPAYTVFLLLCSPRGQRSYLKYPFLYTKSLFPQIYFHYRNERTKSTSVCESFGISWNKKVNIHTATVRPATKFMDPCKHLNTQLPPAMPAVHVRIQYCCTEVHFHSHMYKHP